MSADRYIHDEGTRFRIWRYAGTGSLEIERIDDGANLFLQGDDVSTLEGELDGAQRAKDAGHIDRNPCDYTCEAYESVLSRIRDAKKSLESKEQ